MSAPAQASPTPVPPEIEARALRNALGQFATGVTVVTTLAADRGLVGLTANSFSALSLDPPLVLWSLRDTSPSMPAFQSEDRFAINVLAEAQVEVSRRFATPLPDKFDGVAHALSEHGMPLLHGAAAWFECRTIARHRAGDHVLFIAAVERFTAAEQAPLLFHGGKYFALGSRL